MLFNSYTFIFGFLPIVLGVFFAIGRTGSRTGAVAWLTAASLAFYGWWNPSYLGLIVASVAGNYTLARVLAGASAECAKSWWLAVGVVANLGLLGYFKYANFFVENVNWALGTEWQLDSIVLPLAISFFTFQQVAYLVDVRRAGTCERSLLRYCLFVTFFPQFIAGPIVHHREMLPQLVKPSTLVPSARHLAIGVTIFTLGLFKKVVIADSVALVANSVFGAAEAGRPLDVYDAWLGALAYALQIYFDFSGYSDMAIGLGRLFGVRLPLNFAAPYKASNIIDFWRRWHITLSRFLRDYLYIPLGGNRKGRFRRFINVMLTMLIGGLWHGAAWNFVLWGGLHGGYLVANHAWQRLVPPSPAAGNRKVRRALGWCLTFFAVVVAWVPFRAKTLEAAWAIWGSMFGTYGVLRAERPLVEAPNALPIVGLIVLSLVLPATHEFLARYRPALGADALNAPKFRLFVWRPTTAWAFVSLLLFLASVAMMQRTTEFLYFQF